LDGTIGGSVQRAVATRVANGPVADVIKVITEDDPAPRPGWTVVRGQGRSVESPRLVGDS
jgi:hypothetical protein